MAETQRGLPPGWLRRTAIVCAVESLAIFLVYATVFGQSLAMEKGSRTDDVFAWVLVGAAPYVLLGTAVGTTTAWLVRKAGLKSGDDVD